MRAAMAGSHPARPLQGNASLPACRVKARGSRSEETFQHVLSASVQLCLHPANGSNHFQ